MDKDKLNNEKKRLEEQVQSLMSEWVELDKKNTAVCIMSHEDEDGSIVSTVSYHYKNYIGLIIHCAAAINNSPELSKASMLAMKVREERLKREKCEKRENVKM